MNVPFLVPSCLFITVLLASCSKRNEPEPNRPGPGQPASKEAAHPHEHGERVSLGEAKVGGLTLTVFRLAKLEPGHELDLDLDFPAGTALPGTLRGWIGSESGTGSMKTLFHKDTATRMHGHCEVPNPLPEGSRLWLELEGSSGSSRTSVAIRP